MKNVSNCLLVILKAVIIQELPPSVLFGVALDVLRITAYSRLPVPALLKEKECAVQVLNYRFSQSGICVEPVLLPFSKQHRVTTWYLYCIW